MKWLDKTKKFLRDVYRELKFKITWPSVDDLKEGTLVVIVMSIISGVFLSVVDIAFGFIINHVVFAG